MEKLVNLLRQTRQNFKKKYISGLWTREATLCRSQFRKHIFFNLLILISLCWIFVAVHRLSLVVVSGAFFLGEVKGLLVAVVSLIVKHRL